MQITTSLGEQNLVFSAGTIPCFPPCEGYAAAIKFNETDCGRAPMSTFFAKPHLNDKCCRKHRIWNVQRIARGKVSRASDPDGMQLELKLGVKKDVVAQVSSNFTSNLHPVLLIIFSFSRLLTFGTVFRPYFPWICLARVMASCRKHASSVDSEKEARWCPTIEAEHEGWWRKRQKTEMSKLRLHSYRQHLLKWSDDKVAKLEVNIPAEPGVQEELDPDCEGAWEGQGVDRIQWCHMPKKKEEDDKEYVKMGERIKVSKPSCSVSKLAVEVRFTSHVQSCCWTIRSISSKHCDCMESMENIGNRQYP